MPHPPQYNVWIHFQLKKKKRLKCTLSCKIVVISITCLINPNELFWFMNMQIFLFPLLLFYCSSATHFPPHPSRLHPALCTLRPFLHWNVTRSGKQEALKVLQHPLMDDWRVVCPQLLIKTQGSFNNLVCLFLDFNDVLIPVNILVIFTTFVENNTTAQNNGCCLCVLFTQVKTALP